MSDVENNKIGQNNELYRERKLHRSLTKTYKIFSH